MPRLPRLGARRGAVVLNYVPGLRTVPFGARLLPSAQVVARALGLGRLALGAGFLVAPVTSVRILGLDTATAKRITFLARMAAGRDLGLGGGVLVAGPTRAAAPWLLAGAAADAVDAAVIGAAIKQGTAGGVPAAAITVGAAGAAGLGIWAALALRRH